MRLLKQPKDSGLCGHYSIYNACVLAGIPKDHDDIHQGHGRRKLARFIGIDETRLIRALDLLEVDCETKIAKTATTAITYICKQLSNGFPLIAAVANGEHWTVIAGFTGTGFIIVDSYETPMIQEVRIDEFIEWVDDDFYFITIKHPSPILPLVTASKKEVSKLLKQL